MPEHMSESEFDDLAANALAGVVSEPKEVIEEEEDPAEEVENEVLEEEVLEEEGTHLSYDDYIAAGRDPDAFMGKAAYERSREFLDEKKAAKAQEKLAKEQTENLASITKELELQRKERDAEIERQHKAQIADLEQQITEAKDNLNVEEVERLALEKAESERRPSQQQEHVSIVEMRQSDSRLDKSSADYDAELEMDIASMLNSRLHNKAQQAGRELTDGEWRQAVKAVHSRFDAPEKTKEKKPARKAAPVASPSGRVSKGSPVSNLSESQRSLYNEWSKSKDPLEQAAAKRLLLNHGA